MQDTSTTVKTAELRFDAAAASLCRMLVDHFQVARDPREICLEDSLFSAGVGLSSMEGMELLCLLESKFGVRIDDLDYWLEHTPSVRAVAQYLVEHAAVYDSSSSS
jgi:acyl carrier protein